MRLLFVIFLPLMFFGSLSSATEPKVDLIIVEKSARLMMLFKNDKLVKKYDIALGRTPVGKKEFDGDGKTPEGHYFISFKKENSDFFKALQISYPNKLDRKRASQNGKEAGGQIMIHGLRNDMEVIPSMLQWLHSYLDWTDGCIAVTNSEMNEIFDLVPLKTSIWIYP